MIYSMTAFGRTQKESAGFSVTIEIRSLNNRNLDIYVKIGKNFLEFEEAVRKRVATFFRRGRIEVFVQIEPTAVEQKAPRLNLELVRSYWQQLHDLRSAIPEIDAPNLSHLLSIPYIFEPVQNQGNHAELRDILLAALTDAAKKIVKMRAEEGRSLCQDCLERLAFLRNEITRIEQRKTVVLREYRDRIHEKVKEFLEGIEIDENRLLQEVAFLAERSDINEEVVRVRSHLEQFERSLRSQDLAEGRKLDFLTQELHREVNTIGCKTNDLETIQGIIKMKSEIGKLREQIQNVE